jgi:hypothetical protein
MAGAVRADGSGLDGAEDFGLIARNGFARTVDGAFFADGPGSAFPSLVPNLGSPDNSYAWSAAWLDGALWIGTNRDVLCFDSEAAPLLSLLGPLTGDCPEPGPLGNRLPGPGQRGEIWRYTPSSLDTVGHWGLGGIWDLVYRSPSVLPLPGPLGGTRLNVPRDVGYRSMSVCDAGDGIRRLYVASLGLPGRILYLDGDDFVPTSGRGLHAHLRDLVLGRADLGFRALTCFKGRLWTSPAGTLADVDTALHPVVYMNADPAAQGPWRAVVDVSSPDTHPLADPDNIGIFQMEAVGDYLWLSTINRVSGFELWRGDGRDCLVPWEGDGHCRINWTKVIDAGAGRPPDLRGPAVDNAGATLGVFGEDLYVGASESGINRITLAELIRVPGAASPPEADPSVPHEWELLVGWPRRDYADPAGRLPGLENLACERVGDMADEPPAGWNGLPLTALDDDTAADDCLPTLNSGPGWDLSGSGPLSLGTFSYLWRFQEHHGELFLGTLDVFSLIDPRLRAGFDLLRTADGLDWRRVSDDGFGNLFNYGARSILSVPGLGLVVGTANPFSGAPAGGAEIYVGTTAPGPSVPPLADAGRDRLIFDFDHDGRVKVRLHGTGTDPFGGPGITGYAWYRGALGAECTDLAGTHADALFSTAADTGPLVLTSEAGDPGTPGHSDRVHHSFTLQVESADGGLGCDEVSVTASLNLPPSGEVAPEVPIEHRVVEMTDYDGDGAESYGITGVCLDPEGLVVHCAFEPDGPGARVIAQAPLDCSDLGRADAQACVSAMVSVLATDRLDPDAGLPGLALRVEDGAGYTSRFRWQTRVSPLTGGAGAGDGEDVPGPLRRLLERLVWR